MDRILSEPADSDLIVRLIRSEFAGPEPEAALRWLDRLQSVEGGESAAFQDTLDFIRLRTAKKAKAQFSTQNREKALQILDSYLSVRPLDVDILERKSNVLLKTEDREQCFECLKAVLAVSPARGSALLVCVKANALDDRIDEATRWCRRAIAADPADESLRDRLVGLKIRAGDAEGALADCLTLLEKSPDNPAATAHSVNLLTRLNQPYAADTAFDRLVELQRRMLPPELAPALAALDGPVRRKPIPADSLEWAWEISKRRDLGYDAWSYAATWGQRAVDLFKSVWRYQPERHSEIADIVETPDTALGELRSAVASGRETMVVTAHLGAMPLIFHVLSYGDFPVCFHAASRFVPVPGRNHRTLIHATGRTLVETRELLSAVSEGTTVAVAVDSYADASSVRQPFLGRRIRFSQFPARLIARKRARSFYFSAYWTGVEGRLRYELVPLPDPPSGGGDRDAVREWERGWRAAVLTQMERYMTGDPVNLNLSGGVWRCQADYC